MNFEWDILNTITIVVIALLTGFYYHIHGRIQDLSRRLEEVVADVKNLRDHTINGKIDKLSKEVKEQHKETKEQYKAIIDLIHKFEHRVTRLEATRTGTKKSK